MAILSVGGVTISVARETAPHSYDEVNGDRARMLDATMRSMEPTRKNVWSLRTRLLTAAELTTQQAALQGTPPMSCTGDPLNGTYSCFVKIDGIDRVPVITGVVRYQIRFTLFEQ
jgi:hypothetical protein